MRRRALGLMLCGLLAAPSAQARMMVLVAGNFSAETRYLALMDVDQARRSRPSVNQLSLYLYLSNPKQRQPVVEVHTFRFNCLTAQTAQLSTIVFDTAGKRLSSKPADTRWSSPSGNNWLTEPLAYACGRAPKSEVIAGDVDPYDYFRKSAAAGGFLIRDLVLRSPDAEDRAAYYFTNGIDVFKHEDMEWALVAKTYRGSDSIVFDRTATSEMDVKLRLIRSIAGTATIEVIKRDPRVQSTVGSFFYKIEVNCSYGTTRYAEILKLNRDFSTTAQPIAPSLANPTRPTPRSAHDRLLRAVCKAG